MSTRVRSFAKINLGLAVGPARTDGFHGLTTAYQTVGLHDFVTVTAREAEETRITLTADHPGVPRTETGDAEKNTAFVMVAKALQRMGLLAEVAIGIEKRLPVQGGMGAGSANAVAALLGLERELGMALPGGERMSLAAEVGSDVPLFLIGGTVLGLGRGGKRCFRCRICRRCRVWWPCRRWGFLRSWRLRRWIGGWRERYLRG